MNYSDEGKEIQPQEELMIQCSPESSINNLSKVLTHFDASLSHSMTNQSARSKEIREIRKELDIIDSLFNDYVIAVAGCQGVGKSTLVLNYLGLTDELPVSMGNDENYPVYITEIVNDSLKQPRVTGFYKRAMSADGEIELLELEKEQFQKEVQGKEDLNIIRFEIEIEAPPHARKLFSRKMVVLPGYDAQLRSPELMRILKAALRHAAVCVFCFDAPTFATESNSELLNGVIIPYFSRSAPILALTKNAPDKENDELRQNVINTLSVGNDDLDRVISVWGKEDGSDVGLWIEKLGVAINKYSFTMHGFREQQLNNVSELMERLRRVIDDISDDDFLRDLRNDITYRRYLQPYSDSKNRYLGRFYRRLRESLNNAAREVATEFIGGVLNREFFSRIGKFFQYALDRDRKYDQLMEVITGELNEPISQAIIDAFNQVITRADPEQYANDLEETNDEHGLRLWYTHATLDERLPALEKPDDREAYKALLRLFGNAKKEQNKHLVLSGKPELGMENALNALPLIALEWIRLSQAFKVGSPQSVEAKDYQPMFEAMAGEIEVEKAGLNKFVIGVASLIGVDGAVDGTINSIPAIFKAMGVTLSGAALSYVLWGAVAVVAADILWRSVLKSEKSEKAFIANICSSAADETYKVLQDRIDEYFSGLEMILYDRLKVEFHQERDYDNAFNYQRYKTAVIQATNNILEMVAYADR